MGEIRNAHRILVENLPVKDHSKDLGLGGKITLKWISEKPDLGVWIGLIWLRIGSIGGLF
jgi:hypothetical protein